MAHFAELDGDSKVIRVIVVSNEDAPNEDAGIAFIKSMSSIPNDSVWKKCSYNTIEGTHTRGGTPFRKNYPGEGDLYDATRDAFIRAKPSGFPSWILDEDTCVYKPPVAEPSDSFRLGGTKGYRWDEDNTQWVFVEDVE